MSHEKSSPSQPRASHTIQICMENADLLAAKEQPTQHYMATPQGESHVNGGGTIPTAHIENKPVHTQLVSSPGRKKQSVPAEKWTIGWLVALSGPMQGLSYSLGIGNTHIGRGAKNTIALAADPGISEDSQVIITHVKGRDEFFITPSLQGTQTTLVNDAILLSPQLLKPRDVITFSDDTKMCFIPFCGKDFHWDYTQAQ